MFVRRRGVWFGSGAEKMFMFCSAKSRKLVFGEDDCHPTLHSLTNNAMADHNGYLRKPGRSCFYE